MVQFRKASSKIYISPLPPNRGGDYRMRVTRKSIVYCCTVLAVTLLLSYVSLGPGTAGILPPWTIDIGQRPPVSVGMTAPGVVDDTEDSEFPQDNEVTSRISKTMPPQEAPVQHYPLTENGFPLISTSNNSTLVLLTGVTGPSPFSEIPNSYSMIFKNRLEYVNAHGYDFMTVDLGRYRLTKAADPVWGKLPAILEAFGRYPSSEWIWWLDVDAIIMTPEIDIFQHVLDPQVLNRRLREGDPILVMNEKYTPSPSGLYTMNPGVENVGLIISQDQSGLNAGSFFIRNSPTMKLLVDLWSDSLIIDKTPSWNQKEQDALLYLLVNHWHLRERVGFVAQRLINAYPTGLQWWAEGELLVHFAGCWVDSECSELFGQFWPRRKTVSSRN